MPQKITLLTCKDVTHEEDLDHPYRVIMIPRTRFTILLNGKPIEVEIETEEEFKENLFYTE